MSGYHVQSMVNVWTKYGDPIYLDWFVGWFMVLNTTFNNISVISWQSVLLVEETGIPGENHRPDTSHWQTLLHNVVSSTPRHDCMTTKRLT